MYECYIDWTAKSETLSSLNAKMQGFVPKTKKNINLLCFVDYQRIFFIGGYESLLLQIHIPSLDCLSGFVLLCSLFHWHNFWSDFSVFLVTCDLHVKLSFRLSQIDFWGGVEINWVYPYLTEGNLSIALHNFYRHHNTNHMPAILKFYSKYLKRRFNWVFFWLYFVVW